MKFALAALALAAAPAFAASPAPAPSCPAVLNHKVDDIVGDKEDLCQYAGKVVLVVNTASKCGYTPQYKSLQALHERYKAKGLVILGFPSNDFGQQEPGSNQEIAEFCDRTYAVKFDMMGKTSVRAAGGSPLYDGLPKATGERPKWNFHKYLVSRDGRTVASFPTGVEPDSKPFVARIEALLAAR